MSRGLGPRKAKGKTPPKITSPQKTATREYKGAERARQKEQLEHFMETASRETDVRTGSCPGFSCTERQVQEEKATQEDSDGALTKAELRKNTLDVAKRLFVPSASCAQAGQNRILETRG